mmetsp:Transcript_23561/g.82014  ORF Transcript_23561/g.82014 Transcript_23561/m.82014 type:complete len:272 (-) Transcript_23561:5600-6415(-)
MRWTMRRMAQRPHTVSAFAPDSPDARSSIMNFSPHASKTDSTPATDVILRKCCGNTVGLKPGPSTHFACCAGCSGSSSTNLNSSAPLPSSVAEVESEPNGTGTSLCRGTASNAGSAIAAATPSEIGASLPCSSATGGVGAIGFVCTTAASRGRADDNQSARAAAVSSFFASSTSALVSSSGDMSSTSTVVPPSPSTNKPPLTSFSSRSGARSLFVNHVRNRPRDGVASSLSASAAAISYARDLASRRPPAGRLNNPVAGSTTGTSPGGGGL